MTVKSVKYIHSIVRSFSTKPTTNNQVRCYMYNRNPRNLEKLRIDRKPTGYPLELSNNEYWHKLELKNKATYVVARLIHNTRKVVVEASTNEWAICKHLHSKKDTMAYIVLGRVFAERCQETGIYSFYSDISREHGTVSKVQLFLNILQEENLMLYESPQYDINRIWYKKIEKKPWTVLED